VERELGGDGREGEGNGREGERKGGEGRGRGEGGKGARTPSHMSGLRGLRENLIFDEFVDFSEWRDLRIGVV